MKIRSRRPLRALTAALLLIVLATGLVFADTEYSGVLNPRTNQPAGTSQSSSSAAGDRDLISTGCYYDWTSHDYVYPVDGSLTEVHCSAADGMILNTPVSIDLGGDATISVYYNGSEYTGDASIVNSPGDYVVQARVNGANKRVLSFTLVGPYASSIQTFSVPDGFFITAATRDGVDIYLDRYLVDMGQEGTYSVSYECMSTDLTYTLDVIIDRTPPSLSFSGHIGQDNQVRSALKFSGVEPGGRVSLIRNGEITDVDVESDGTGIIRDTGIYLLRVYDAAGNMREYNFSILMYFDTSSWIFFLLVLASIGAVAGYILIKRKRLKIG